MPTWPWQQFAQHRRMQQLTSQPSAAILCYHRVLNTTIDPMLLCISKENFEQQLIYLKQNYNPVSLNNLADMHENQRMETNSIALTFDDGYADNLINALPLLEKYEIPATIFVASGQIDSPHEFWWDELERILLGKPNEHWPFAIQVPIKYLKKKWQVKPQDNQTLNSDKELGWDVTKPYTPSPRHLAYRELHAILKPLSHHHQSNAIAAICRQLNTQTAGRSENLALTTPQLQTLSLSKYIDIGAHTVNHPQLSALTDDEQVEEIKESKIRLEQIIGKTITNFSYPYGGSLDYTPMTKQICIDAGFKNACANIPGVVTESQKPIAIDRFQLPRFLVRNWDQITFTQQIDRMLLTPSRVAA